MNRTIRPDIPQDKIIRVKNSRRIDFSKPYKFIYMDWWYELLIAIPYLITYIILIFSALFFGLRIIGRKNLKILAKQGCITISNHCHYFDTVFASFAVLPRPLHTAVAQRNFEVPKVRKLLRIFRCFPVPSNVRGLEMISVAAGEALARKHHIHFLPEGDLVMYSQTIHRFKPGAFFLSYRHQAPIVPMVYIIKPRKFFGKPMGASWVKLILVIGEPFFPPRLRDFGAVQSEEIEEMSDKAALWMEQTIAAYSD